MQPYHWLYSLFRKQTWLLRISFLTFVAGYVMYEAVNAYSIQRSRLFYLISHGSRLLLTATSDFVTLSLFYWISHSHFTWFLVGIESAKPGFTSFQSFSLFSWVMLSMISSFVKRSCVGISMKEKKDKKGKFDSAQFFMLNHKLFMLQ